MAFNVCVRILARTGIYTSYFHERFTGRHTTHTNQIYFDEVRVPVGRLIGEESNGWKKLMRGAQP